eukprot:1647487-Lingulodinium_polyedra.AAC.1
MELETAVALMADIGWSTVSTEQQHASASTLAKSHPGYSREAVMSRAMVHMMRPLVKQDPQELKLSELEAKLHR